MSSPTLAAPAAEPAWIERADRLSRAASRWLASAGAAGMLVLAALTVTDAVLRWFWTSPFEGLNEVVSLFFAAAVAACLPYALSIGAELTVDLLAARMSSRVSALLEAAGSFLNLLFFALIAWHVGRFAQELAEQGRVTIILRWPEPPFMYALALLFVIVVLVQVLACVRAVCRARVAFSETSALAMPLDSLSLGVVGAALAAMLLLAFYAVWDFEAMRDLVRSNPMAFALIGLLLLWLLLLAKFPMGAAMGMVGVAGSILFLDLAPAMSALGTTVAGFLRNSEVSVLPLFLLMGSIAAAAGMAEDIYRLAHALLSGLRGGLALATIGGCAGFGAVTGSSVATVATIGKIALPEMRQRSYAAELTYGCIAAGGTLGQLVPPSTAIIVYALLTEQSIGQLFVGLIVPACLAVLLYFATIVWITRLNPASAPETARPQFSETVAAARRALGAVLLFLVVIGGLYSGVFTATESASAGVVGTFAYALIRGKLNRGTFRELMADATVTIGMIYILIIGAITFSFFVGASGMPDRMTAWVSGLQVEPLVLIAIILAIYVALGCVMDSFGVLIITTPIIAPLVAQSGYDLVWWGIVMVVVVETGMITPPFGLNIFVLKSLADAPLSTIYRGCIPFVVADFVKIAIMVLVPATVLWLPSTMFR